MGGISKARILAEALKTQGVEYMFGVVGWPVRPLANAAQAAGIKFIGMRNEQAASYAAQAIGFLTKRPGACLTVPGPGMLNTIPGMANAMVNSWPMLVISGAGESQQEAMGSFQEYPQVDSARIHCKYAARPSSAERIPIYVEKAVRTSLFGRPGACYLDIPADFITGQAEESQIEWSARCPAAPRTLADPDDIEKAVDMLKSANRPLVIIGKGSAYSRAEDSIRKLIVDCNLPFLPTPMGKGVLPDDHQLCVAPARSRALQNADVILLLGAKLNWILHFGAPPRFNKFVKIIQVDIEAEELNNNVPTGVALNGDIDSVVKQMNDHMKLSFNSTCLDLDSSWWKLLRQSIEENAQATQTLIDELSPPLNFYNSLYEIGKLLPKDSILVTEGSHTMNVSRTMINNYFPRHRLDAGTFATMGVGAGFAIAAATWCKDHEPDKLVVCLQGDSAFGFSGMEIETACRYQLPILFIVLNNAGITQGISEQSYYEMLNKDLTLSLPPGALLPGARYEKIMEAFGGSSYLITTREDLAHSLSECLKNPGPSLLNVIINPTAGRKKQEFEWLTSKASETQNV